MILKFRKTDDINCKTETSDRRAHKMPFEISDDKSRWNVFDLAKVRIKCNNCMIYYCIIIKHSGSIPSNACVACET